jgi:hypothetical protein
MSQNSPAWISFPDASKGTLKVIIGIKKVGKGGVKMEKMEVKNLGSPEEVRTFDKGKVELVKIGGRVIGRATFQPGWKWSESVKPLVKTKSCEAPHFQYHVSGTLRVHMDDGTEKDLNPGDVSLLPMGHDAWVVGNEPVVVVDFQGMIDYAKKKSPKG